MCVYIDKCVTIPTFHDTVIRVYTVLRTCWLYTYDIIMRSGFEPKSEGIYDLNPMLTRKQ